MAARAIQRQVRRFLLALRKRRAVEQARQRAVAMHKMLRWVASWVHAQVRELHDVCIQPAWRGRPAVVAGDGHLWGVVACVHACFAHVRMQ